MLAPGFEPGSMDRESIMMDLATPRERNRPSSLSMINGTEGDSLSLPLPGGYSLDIG